MSLTNFPHGITSFGAPVIPAPGSHTGNVFWVDSGATLAVDDPTSGSYEVPFKTLNYAIGRCTASNGDVIYVKEGHTETVSAAAGLVFDVIGVTVYFLGEGSNRATITFTATAADMDVTAANVTLVGPRFLTGIDAVVAAIHVAAADFHMINAEYYDAAAKATTIQVLTTSAADRMIIDGYKFIASTTGTQKTDGIKVVGGDSIVLKNIDIRGDFSVACIDNASTAGTNWLLENIYVNDTNATPKPGIVLQANTTGFAKNVKSRVASGTTYVSSVAKISWGDDCEGFSTDGYAGEPIGTALASGLEGKIDVIDGYFDVPTADATTDVTMRDVVGKKNDAAVGSVTTNKSLMGYTKGILEDTGTTLPGLITVPTADATTNTNMRDVIGNKTDAAIYALAADKSIAAYIKGLLATAPRTAQSASATALTNGATLFTIAGGPIAIEYLISICIATGDGGAATLQYNSAPTVGSAATISGATGSLATAVAGSMVVFVGTALNTAPTFLTTGHGVASTGPSKIVVNEGTITAVVGGDASTATWKHYIRYTPLATGVTVA